MLTKYLLRGFLRCLGRLSAANLRDLSLTPLDLTPQEGGLGANTHACIRDGIVIGETLVNMSCDATAVVKLNHTVIQWLAALLVRVVEHDLVRCHVSCRPRIA